MPRPAGGGGIEPPRARTARGASPFGVDGALARRGTFDTRHTAYSRYDMYKEFLRPCTAVLVHRVDQEYYRDVPAVSATRYSSIGSRLLD